MLAHTHKMVYPQFQERQSEQIHSKVRLAADRRSHQGGRGSYASATASQTGAGAAQDVTLEAIRSARDESARAYATLQADMRTEFGGRLVDLGSKLDTVLQRTEVTDAVLFERAQDGSFVNRLEAFQGVVVAVNAGATVLQNGLMQLHGTHWDCPTGTRGQS